MNSTDDSDTTGTISITASSGVKGGIAWGGSLVGSLNPDNHLGYRSTQLHKRYKRSNEDESSKKEIPSSIIVQFQNRQQEELGTAIDIPTESNVDAMSKLIHTLLNPDDNDDDTDNDENKKYRPYSFYAKIERNGVIDDIEITSSLQQFLLDNPNVSTEQILSLTYQPLSVFRVRPVTRCTDTIPGHTEAVLHVSYSPDGRHLASGGGDTTVRFYDVNTNLPKYTCKDHKNHVLCTAWSPNGERFASADKNGKLIIWDLSKKGTTITADDTKAKPTITKSPFSNSSIKAHGKYISSIAWEPMHKNNGRCERLVTSSKDGTAKIWNVRTRQCIATLAGHADSIECVKWGGEGFIYTASRDRTIKVWNAEPIPAQSDVGKLVKTLKGHGHRVNTLALSCDYVCRTGPFDHKGKIDNHKPISDHAYKEAVSKYNSFKSGEPERLISGSDDFSLFLWHPKESKHPIKRLTGHQQLVNHIAFSPDGRFFASASFDRKVKIWNGKSGDFINTCTGHVGAVYQVAWSSDSRYLVTASKDSTAKLWEVPSGRKAKDTLPGHYDEVYALDWSPDGRSVATGSKDRTIKIWKH